jgi:site-specific recombinase XerD
MTDRVDEWAMYQRGVGFSERTISERVQGVRRVARVSGVSDPTVLQHDDLVRYLASVRSRSSKATYFAQLQAWFRWLVRMDYRVDDPCAKIVAPRAPRRGPRPITDEHFHALLASRMHRRTRMMILLAAYQGLRVHEIAKIRGEDVDLVSLQLRVIGKGDVDATLPLHEKVALFAVSFPRRGWWFPSYDDPARPLLANSVSGVVSRAMTRAGIDGGAHRLRHWYGTTLSQRGVNLRVVQQLMRHASLQTTQIYTLVDDAQMRSAIDDLAPRERRGDGVT